MNFGIDVINQIKVENPHLWTQPFQEQIIQLLREAVDLEIAYAHDTMPRGVLGFNAVMFEDYLGFHRKSALRPNRIAGAIPGSHESVPMDERSHGSEKGKEFL